MSAGDSLGVAVARNQSVRVAATGSAQRPAGLARSAAERLASLKLTLAAMVAVAAATMAIYNQWVATTLVLVPPLAVLAINLGAAIATTAKLRAQLPLAVFHLSLLAIIVLVALGRLTYLKGHVELTDGVPFDGKVTVREQGPWHAGSLEGLFLVNEGFTIDYAPTVKRGPTRNRVVWQLPGEPLQRAEIGDQTPLIVAGYRFYTSFNKGFAVMFEWSGPDSPPAHGAVHLPAWPMHELAQAREWEIPGSERAIWFMLDFDELILDPADWSQFRPPKEYKLVVRDGEERTELREGDSLSFPGGTLHFHGLRSWMGYSVFYDWTLPWIAAASALAVLSLGAHFHAKFRRRAWDA